MPPSKTTFYTFLATFPSLISAYNALNTILRFPEAIMYITKLYSFPSSLRCLYSYRRTLGLALLNLSLNVFVSWPNKYCSAIKLSIWPIQRSRRCLGSKLSAFLSSTRVISLLGVLLRIN